jgi:hypothetical protein
MTEGSKEITMWIRKILVAVAVAAPLAFGPLDALAQGRGSEQAAAVSNAQGGPTVAALPAGIDKKAENGGVVPFGIARRYSPPAPQVEPQPEPEPEPQPEPCQDEIVQGPDGNLYLEKCDGTLIPLFPF